MDDRAGTAASRRTARSVHLRQLEPTHLAFRLSHGQRVEASDRSVRPNPLIEPFGHVVQRGKAARQRQPGSDRKREAGHEALVVTSSIVAKLRSGRKQSLAPADSSPRNVLQCLQRRATFCSDAVKAAKSNCSADFISGTYPFSGGLEDQNMVPARFRALSQG
jgi:hypothetical protein